MDRRPQMLALARAVAAAQAGRTGWAVDGWREAVSYFSRDRVAWSSYGEQHPEEHLEVLRMVDVDPVMLTIGLLFSTPTAPYGLTLADGRRIAPDLGPEF